MISDKRKLWIHIVCKAFRTNNKKLLKKFLDKNIDSMNREEVDYDLSLFK